jgi:solute carrier family 25 aspartate/glutamate transporter 12/13
MNDWANFQNLLTKPDSEYEIAFRLFDEEGTGMIKFENFIHLYNQNRGTNSIGFDWGGAWARLYMGDKKRRHDMTYPQFCQMVRGLQGEKIRQAFKNYDKDGDGYITPEEFQSIILETARHKLSDHLLENLHTLCNISQGSKISYANVRAFQNVIREMDLLDLIVQNAARKSEDGKITRTDFLNEAARLTRFSQFTPMEADILFHFAGLDAPSGRLAWSDFQKVLDSTWRATLSIDDGPAIDTVRSTGQNLLHGVLESVHHFGLGSIAGAFGAFMVYPIDLVKTRMQNQRKTTQAGSQLYANSIDCAKKVIRNEGFRGLYSGVLPQLVGVAPEKAIKLTVNDLVRGYFSEKDTGKIWLPAELLAGGSAGACQVVSFKY